MTVYIVAVGNYYEQYSGELPPLKNLVQETVGSNIRRVGRFIQLALIGAGRASSQLADDAAVYLTSGCGDVDVTVNVLNTIYRQGEAPRPLSFINTVSNAACFYIAQSLGLKGASSFVSSRYFAVETSLRVALLALEQGQQQAALIGAVDIVVLPIEEHRRRLGLGAQTDVAEGSHWFQLVSDASDRSVLATLDAVQHFPDRQVLAAWLSALTFSAEDCLALGQMIESAEADQWLAETGLSQFNFCESIAHFNSQAGIVFCEFVRRGCGRLIYLNRDPVGRYMAVVIRC
ncbi:beta-ketoacyl synthase N-terminal-like domain-containing protein [Zhongshania borealis]|uniref:Beta-ketoacyl synthase-like N-terminal domain-containing protein n=1 Tax=Zhongshania borealis TaxID=889488 RepID=A0ABP7WQR5_9GAMM